MINQQATIPTIQGISQAMSDMRASYEAARETEYNKAPPDLPRWGVSQDWHTRLETDFMYLIEFARHVERNDPAVPQGVARFAANVVQGGYRYKPETGSDAVDRLVNEDWSEWADQDNRVGLDYAMENNWNDYERLSVHRIVFDGDMMINPLNDGRIQPFEAHQIRSPLYQTGTGLSRNRFVINGVEKNRKNQTVAYWVTPSYNEQFTANRAPQQSKKLRAWRTDPITGQNEQAAFHCYIPNRFHQSRGVTTLAPVLPTANQHADVQFAKLVQQQMVSFVGLFHNVPFATNDYDPQGNYETTICPRTGKEIRKAPPMVPGAEYWPMYPGEKIEGFSPNIPNAEFFPHAKLLLTFISLSLGMPLILFLLDATETNFSAWRGALDQAKIQFRQFQRNHASRLHRPVARWRTRRLLARDAGLRRLARSSRISIFNHDWDFPAWPYIEPLTDIKADVAEIASSLNSPRRVAARRNLDYQQIVAEKCQDEQQLVLCAMKAAEVLNSDPYIIANPDERVSWREIAHPNMGEGLQMQILDKNEASSNERAETGTNSNGNGRLIGRRVAA